MPPDDLVRLRHMIDALESVGRMIAGRQRDDLDRDEMLRLALTRAIEVVGEAAARVTEAVRTQAAHIPWRQLTRMRNRLIHAYFDVDLDIVWTTATRDVPLLLGQIRAVIDAQRDP